MKDSYRKAGVPIARHHMVTPDKAAAEARKAAEEAKAAEKEAVTK